MDFDDVTVGTVLGCLVVNSTSDKAVEITEKSGVNPMMLAIETLVKRLQAKKVFTNSALQSLVEKHREMGYANHEDWMNQALNLAPWSSKRFQGMLFQPLMSWGTLDQVLRLFEITEEALSEDDINHLAVKVKYDQASKEKLMAVVKEKRPDLVEQAEEALKKTGSDMEDDIPF